MKFGAHETMETHEILMEKVNMITHFNLYASQAQNPQLQDMIVRHQQEEIRSYNELVSLTRGNNQFQPIPPNTNIRGVNHQQIQYGLKNPPRFEPQADGVMNDAEIAMAMLCCHKNAARNSAWGSLECADPNLRHALLNAHANCNNQAYEVFLFMNQQGVYQVPTMNPRTEETFLHSYQPASGALQAAYGVQQGGQNAGAMGTTGYGATGYMNMANAGGGMGNPGARNSFLYGAGPGAGPGAGAGMGAGAGAGAGSAAFQSSAGASGTNNNMMSQGQMRS
jgi:spore coat protein CotF